ncbi:MAG: type III-A CRISPR-associated RAMP protein Csm3 [Desulfobacterales bacterium]|nr:type III-A CRISPR-associated RAMP protein Csm3 [Desulfobacterales bacterium]
MRLSEIREITGKIILRSGLHIGAGDTEMRIGGTDNPVVKHPHTMEPYIPGSSIKGKVRSLIEMRSGFMTMTDGEPVSTKLLKSLQGSEREECEKILKLFGSSGADIDESNELGPSRVSFSDCELDEEWRQHALEENLPLTETKSENSIDRIRGVALNPRFTERVPSGAEFRFKVNLKKLGSDEDLEGLLLEGLKLLEMDALGGSGSRGYGRIEFQFNDPKTRERFASVKAL